MHMIVALSNSESVKVVRGSGSHHEAHTPERIREVSKRLGVSFKATGKTGVVVKRKPKQIVK